MLELRELWRILPESVRRGLLAGTEGSVYLMELAQHALQIEHTAGKDHTALLRMGTQFLTVAWTKDPLNGQLSGQLLTLHEKLHFLDAQIYDLVKTVHASWTPPTDTRYYKRLLTDHNAQKIRHFLHTQIEREPENMYWCRQALVFAQFEEDWTFVQRVVDNNRWPQSLRPVQHLLLGDLAWLQGDFESARTHFSQSFGVDAQFRLALLESRTKGADAARPYWQAVLGSAPWLTSAVLTCHDLLQGLDRQRNTLSGPGVIALYSFNKATELHQTLASIFASDTEDVPVWVVNNGSSDQTSDVLSGWRERIGERMRVITLPVNVGAPAARNWLLHEAAHADYRWMAYVDDDVEVPQDWLSLLGAAVHMYPEAGVWGCKVVDAVAPAVLQSVDLHLFPPDEYNANDTRFKVSDLHHQTHDFGQFDYIRPCSSVTGCCHLFQMDRLIQTGGFDLRFSPSQYDDLEHDIRLNLDGQYAVYQGYLRILHHKRTGKSTRNDSAQFGSAMANMYKLQKKYTPSEYQRLMDWEAEVLSEDFWRKYAIVEQWLSEEK